MEMHMSIYVPEKNTIPKDELRRETLRFAYQILFDNRKHEMEVLRSSENPVDTKPIELSEVLEVASKLEQFIVGK